MTRAKRTLTGLELEIMKVIWRLGPATVRQVYEIGSLIAGSPTRR